MSARTGHTQDGKESEHSLDNTGARRFLVIEQDAGNVDDQSAILLHLAKRAPLALAVHRGSKSIHGWVHGHGTAGRATASVYALRGEPRRGPSNVDAVAIR